MSRSDMPRARRLEEIAAELREMAGEGQVPAVELGEMVAAATVLYAAAVSERRCEVALSGSSMDATAAVVLACALLRSQDLNPFDLTLWFGRVVRDES